MGMFLNYQNIADNYMPNNLVCSFPVGKSYTKLDPVQASRPYEEYNAKGELIGYFWHHGETLNLEFNIDGEITVETGSIILNSAGQTPPLDKGYVDQRAYNIVDLRSWTCMSINTKGERVWKIDDEFIYDVSGSDSVYVSAKDYLKDKFIDVTLYNFRMEPIHTETFNGTSKVVFTINKELSEKLVKGIYYCSLTVRNDRINLPIFSSKDCTLLVK